MTFTYHESVDSVTGQVTQSVTLTRSDNLLPNYLETWYVVKSSFNVIFFLTFFVALTASLIIQMDLLTGGQTQLPLQLYRRVPPGLLRRRPFMKIRITRKGVEVEVEELVQDRARVSVQVPVKAMVWVQAQVKEMVLVQVPGMELAPAVMVQEPDMVLDLAVMVQELGTGLDLAVMVLEPDMGLDLAVMVLEPDMGLDMVQELDMGLDQVALVLELDMALVVMVQERDMGLVPVATVLERDMAPVLAMVLERVTEPVSVLGKAKVLVLDMAWDMVAVTVPDLEQVVPTALARGLVLDTVPEPVMAPDTVLVLAMEPVTVLELEERWKLFQERVKWKL